MPVADWNVPFFLHAALFNSTTDLLINQPIVFPAGVGNYRLDNSACKLRSTVRATKENVPQQDGSIINHRRYVTGMEMDLVVQLWGEGDQIACDDLLQQMLDNLMGYAYGLLNAGDNEGRVYWNPAGGSSPVSTARMLDDVRLFVYPDPSQQPGNPYTVPFTVDCALPYAEDLTPATIAIGGTVTNYGNRPLFPVMRLVGTFTQITVANTSTGQQWVYDGSLPGASGTVTSPDYLEVNTFADTVYLNGSGANRASGIVMTDSQFFEIAPGDNVITVSDGGASTMEINQAWA